MFIDNKYSKWYFYIVTTARTRPVETNQYYERHHITPKSLGGDNKVENLVKLTAREHYVCHRLLTKMTVGSDRAKMVYAAWALANQANQWQKRPAVTSRDYEFLRAEFVAERRKWKQPMSYYEKISAYWTEDRRAEQAVRTKKMFSGRKHTEDTKEKFRNKVWTDAAKQSRLNNMLLSAARRKGIPNPDHAVKVFESYVRKNINVCEQIWKYYDSGLNRRQISIMLGISWARVGYAVENRDRIIEVAKR